MNKYAVVQTGVVENIVIWDGEDEWTPPDGSVAVEVPDGMIVAIGDCFDGNKFTSQKSQL